MSRNHYIAIAKLLSEMKYDLSSQLPTLAFDKMVSRVCSVLVEDNSNFNSAKFRDAIYHGKN